MEFPISAVLKTLVDLLTNLSAGWLGLILVAPGFTGYLTLEETSLILLRNLPPAILSFTMAVYIRKEVEK